MRFVVWAAQRVEEGKEGHEVRRGAEVGAKPRKPTDRQTLDTWPTALGPLTMKNGKDEIDGQMGRPRVS